MLEFFPKFPEVTAFMSEREDGSMKLFYSEKEINLANRGRFFSKIGIEPGRVLAAEIVHGNKVEIAHAPDAAMVLGADGLLAREKNIFLSVTIADCMALFLYEPSAQIVGVLHCGWRGIVAEILPKALEKISELGGAAENLQIALGPGIGSCHFEIKKDVLDNFKDYRAHILHREGKIFVDLKGILRAQLLMLGVKEENIENNARCTFEDKRFFSYRRDRPAVTEAMVAVIGMRE